MALYHEKNILWQYNYKTQKGKPFFHPITINGTKITELSPKDHPWHLGIWHSWKYINDINYWEYDLSEDAGPWNYKGVTEIKNLEIMPEDDFSCRFEMEIAYHAIEGNDILYEKRIVTVSAPDTQHLFSIDYNCDFKALAEKVELGRTPLPNEKGGDPLGGYAGLSIRFNTQLGTSDYINPDKSTIQKHGIPGEWTYYGLKTKNRESMGVAIFDHPKSFNYPTPWYIADITSIPLNYLGTAPLFNAPYSMEQGNRIQFEHRVQFYAGQPSFDRLKKEALRYRKNKGEQ